MKTNLKSMRNPALLMAGLMALSICFSGCAPVDKRGFKAKRLEVDTVRIAQLKAQADKKIAEEAKKEAAARRALNLSQNESPDGTPQVELSGDAGANGTAPAVLDTPAGIGALDTPIVLNEGDIAFLATAKEIFSAKIINDGTMTPDQIAASIVELNPELGKSIFAMTLTRSLEAEATADTAAIYNISLEMAARSTVNEQTRANHLALNFSLQAGIVYSGAPDIIESNSGVEEVLQAENVVVYATCADENCAQVLIYVKINPGEEQELLGAFQFKQDEAELESGKMVIVNASTGVENLRDMSDVAVQAELVAASKIPSVEMSAEEAAAALESAGETEETDAVTEEAPASVEASTESPNDNPINNGAQRRAGKPSQVRGQIE